MKIYFTQFFHLKLLEKNHSKMQSKECEEFSCTFSSLCVSFLSMKIFSIANKNRCCVFPCCCCCCCCLCFSYKHNAVVLSGFLLLSVLFSYKNKREIGPLLEYLSRKHVVIQPQKVNSINKLSRLFLNAFTTTRTTISRVKPLICVCLSRFYENT